MAVETLKNRPSLGPIYAKAALAGRKSGSTLPGTTLRLEGYRVDRKDLLDYERVCGFPNTDWLPHTHPHVLGFPLQMQLMSGKDFPLPLMGMVHLSNTITVHRSIHFEEPLDIAVRAEDLRGHPKGRVLDLVTDVDVAGERVWEGRSTYLSRGRGDEHADRGEQPPAVPTGPATAKWSLPGDLGRTYGLTSGDVNPIHMSAVTAKAMGFPKAIAHGMWTYARTIAALGPKAQGPVTSQVWFKKPVLLPAEVDLVVDPTRDPLVAGLRGSRTPETEHLVLTLA